MIWEQQKDMSQKHVALPELIALLQEYASRHANAARYGRNERGIKTAQKEHRTTAPKALQANRSTKTIG